MSAALLRAVHTASAQVLAVWRAMPGAYLMLGRAAGPLPKSGSARLAKDIGSPGIFKTFFWQLGTDQDVGYLAVIRLPDRVRIGDDPEIVLRGARGADRDFALRLAPSCEEEEFGKHLASLAGSSAAALARFVLDLLQPEAEVDVRRPGLLLHSFLRHAARHEGCIELLLEVPNKLVVLQGWGAPIAPDVEIVVTGSGLARHPAQVGEFSRNDVQAPLTGIVLALPAEMAGELANAESVFLLTRDDIFCRRVLDGRVLDAASSIGQIRHLLPRLVCAPALAAALQDALQPQYEGLDTLNSSEKPVRAALDIAVAGEGAGLFLSGWVFDPTNQVTRIDYCAGDVTVQLDTEFVRIQREDVVLAFKGDRSFPSPSRSDVGFAVSVDGAGLSPDRPRLRFTFTDAQVGFIPLLLRSAAEPGIRALLCQMVDMHKPSGIEIIQRHLAPFLTRSQAPEPIGCRTLLRGPLGRPHALVVPLLSSVMPRAILADLLRDPLAEDEEIIFVCGPTWTEARVETLIELLQFYDLPATVFVTPDHFGPVDAVQAAAAHAQADTFLLLSSSAYHGGAGARRALRDAIEHADAVCPTVLYEDGSIRFAGMADLEFIERAPFTRSQAPWVGLSAEHVVNCETTNAVGGTLECCLLGRDALAAAVRARRFWTKFGQEAALFAVLREYGRRVVWLPSVVVATADEGESATAGSVSALVDRWALRANWGETTCVS